MAAPAPIYRGQGNATFRSERRDTTLKRGQTVPYDVNGAPTINPASRTLSVYIADLAAAVTTEPLLRVLLTDDWTMTGGAAKADADATAEAVFPIKEDGVQIGAVTFAAAATTGTVAFSDSTVASGALFDLFPPAVTDATLDNVSITLTLTLS